MFSYVFGSNLSYCLECRFVSPGILPGLPNNAFSSDKNRKVGARSLKKTKQGKTFGSKVKQSGKQAIKNKINFVFSLIAIVFFYKLLGLQTFLCILQTVVYSTRQFYSLLWFTFDRNVFCWDRIFWFYP